MTGDPWAAAAAALFRGPGSQRAVYLPAGGPPIAIRVIRDRRQVDAVFGDGRVAMDSDKAQLQRSDVPRPLAGDRLAIGDDAALADGFVTGGECYVVQGRPALDVEQLSWTCEIVPA